MKIINKLALIMLIFLIIWILIIKLSGCTFGDNIGNFTDNCAIESQYFIDIIQKFGVINFFIVIPFLLIYCILILPIIFIRNFRNI